MLSWLLKKKVANLQKQHGAEPEYILIVKNNLQDPGAKNPSVTAGKFMVYAEGSLLSEFMSKGIIFDSRFVIMANEYNMDTKDVDDEEDKEGRDCDTVWVQHVWFIVVHRSATEESHLNKFSVYNKLWNLLNLKDNFCYFDAPLVNIVVRLCKKIKTWIAIAIYDGCIFSPQIIRGVKNMELLWFHIVWYC